MPKRAIRRHHRERLRKRRRDYFSGAFRDNPGYVAFMIDTPKTCSGDCCGNQRRSRWGGPTMQERRYHFVAEVVE